MIITEYFAFLLSACQTVIKNFKIVCSPHQYTYWIIKKHSDTTSFLYINVYICNWYELGYAILHVKMISTWI